MGKAWHTYSTHGKFWSRKDNLARCEPSRLISKNGTDVNPQALAQRTTMGVIIGDMFVNGRPLDRSSQRKTGYGMFRFCSARKSTL